MITESIHFNVATLADFAAMEVIRKKAFQPIFESFRKILGDTIYEAAQMPEDLAQGALFKSYFDEGSVWNTWKVLLNDQLIGFVAIRLDVQAKVGEIGLNAVDPDFSGQGIGTKIYQFAVQQMKQAGMKVATVATGGDPAHLPARKAYQKAGFHVQIPSVWMCQEV